MPVSLSRQIPETPSEVPTDIITCSTNIKEEKDNYTRVSSFNQTCGGVATANNNVFFLDNLIGSLKEKDLNPNE